MFVKLLYVVGLVHLSRGVPMLVGLDDLADDMMSVGSYVRETRAAPPGNFHKSYQSDGDGEIGYSRKKQGEGKKGYQHFDSYHKKAGDNYEFAKEDSFGHDDGAQDGAYSHNHERKARPYKSERYVADEPEREGSVETEDDEYDSRGELNARYKEPESENIDEHPRRKKNKEGHTKTRGLEELKEGVSDGNGGLEAYGHDTADYVLPEKYVYGNGDEYNF